MSRIGKLAIKIPAGVTVDVRPTSVVVKGPKGELRQDLRSGIKVEVLEGEVKVSIADSNSREQRSLWGLYRTLVNNMILGVTDGFLKKMEIKGVGYRAQVQGDKIILNLGFSHPVDFPLPSGISAVVEGNFLTISGHDKYLVGQVAANIRKLRLPEPYKGKGIRYVDEVIRRKAGKAAAK